MEIGHTGRVHHLILSVKGVEYRDSLLGDKNAAVAALGPDGGEVGGSDGLEGVLWGQPRPYRLDAACLRG